MTFTKTGPNSARGEDGYEVKIAKRDKLHVIAGDATTVVPIEIMTDRVVVVSLSTVPAAQRETLRQHISAALDFLNIPYRFTELSAARAGSG